VAYEAGPTGFGLARAGAQGIRCEVAAPSKLQRPSGVSEGPGQDGRAGRDASGVTKISDDIPMDLRDIRPLLLLPGPAYKPLFRPMSPDNVKDVSSFWYRDHTWQAHTG